MARLIRMDRSGHTTLAEWNAIDEGAVEVDEIARRFGLRESLITSRSVEGSGLTAKRSHNLWLSIHKLSTALRHEIPDFSTGLDGFYTQYQQGYPQKIRSYQQPDS